MSDLPAIGFAVNESLFLATVITGSCALAWRFLRRREVLPRGAAVVAWVGELFVVAALMLGCRVALADWQHVPSGSMEPTLQVGDMLFINHLAYGPRLPFTNTALPMGEPKRGDIVVFRNPVKASEFWVKRLIGLPGDKVHFSRGIASVNGDALQAEPAGWGSRPEDFGQMLLNERVGGVEHAIKIHPAVRGTMPLSIEGDACTTAGPGEWDCTVPAGHYMMLGDNRDNSADSRYFGFLPAREVYGRVDRVIFNYREWTRWFHKV